MENKQVGTSSISQTTVSEATKDGVSLIAQSLDNEDTIPVGVTTKDSDVLSYISQSIDSEATKDEVPLNAQSLDNEDTTESVTTTHSVGNNSRNEIIINVMEIEDILLNSATDVSESDLEINSEIDFESRDLENKTPSRAIEHIMSTDEKEEPKSSCKRKLFKSTLSEDKKSKKDIFNSKEHFKRIEYSSDEDEIGAAKNKKTRLKNASTIYTLSETKKFKIDPVVMLGRKSNGKRSFKDLEKYSHDEDIRKVKKTKLDDIIDSENEFKKISSDSDSDSKTAIQKVSKTKKIGKSLNKKNVGSAGINTKISLENGKTKDSDSLSITSRKMKPKKNENEGEMNSDEKENKKMITSMKNKTSKKGGSKKMVGVEKNLEVTSDEDTEDNIVISRKSQNQREKNKIDFETESDEVVAKHVKQIYKTQKSKSKSSDKGIKFRDKNEPSKDTSLDDSSRDVDEPNKSPPSSIKKSKNKQDSRKNANILNDRGDTSEDENESSKEASNADASSSDDGASKRPPSSIKKSKKKQESWKKKAKISIDRGDSSEDENKSSKETSNADAFSSDDKASERPPSLIKKSKKKQESQKKKSNILNDRGDTSEDEIESSKGASNADTSSSDDEASKRPPSSIKKSKKKQESRKEKANISIDKGDSSEDEIKSSKEVSNTDPSSSDDEANKRSLSSIKKSKKKQGSRKKKANILIDKGDSSEDVSNTEENNENHDISSSEEKSNKRSQNPMKNSSTKQGSKDMNPHKDPRIIRLKNYLKLAGIRIQRYDVFWEGCKSNKAKAKKIVLHMQNMGLRGNPSKEKCSKLRERLERKKEIEALDKGNILDTPNKKNNGKRTRTRSTRNQDAKLVKSPVVNEEYEKQYSRLKLLCSSGDESSD